MLAGERLDRAAAGIPYRLLLMLIAAVLVVAAVGTVLWRRAQDQAAAPTYQTAKATTTNVVSTVTATGPVSSAQSIPLSFKNSGRIAKFDVQIGDTVKAGQTLAEQDTADLQNSLNQAKAALAQQQANLAKVRQGSTPQAIAVSQAQVDADQKALDNAKKNLATVQGQNATDLTSAQVAVQNDQTALSDAQRNADAIGPQVAAAQKADATAVQNA